MSVVQRRGAAQTAEVGWMGEDVGGRGGGRVGGEERNSSTTSFPSSGEQSVGG